MSEIGHKTINASMLHKIITLCNREDIDLDLLLSCADKIPPLLGLSAGYLMTMSLCKKETALARFFKKNWLKFMVPQIHVPVENLSAEIYTAAMFDKNAAMFTFFPLHLIIQQVKRILSPDRILEVLDLGGGSGFYSAMFHLLDTHVTYMDRDPIAKLLPLKLASKIRVLNHEYIPGETILNYDIIFISEVLHGRSLTQQLNMLKALANRLKPGGALIINEVDPTAPNIYAQYFQTRMDIMTNNRGYVIAPETFDKTNLAPWNKFFYQKWGTIYYLWIGTISSIRIG